jgi:hypothetical protein
MAGHSRSKNGVLKDAYDPVISINKGSALLSGITGTNPVMTEMKRPRHRAGSLVLGPVASGLKCYNITK